MRDFASHTPFGLRSSLRGQTSLAALVLATPGLVAAYDPSDLSTLFQDAAGTIPAGVGDPVRLMLDKPQGLLRGPEIAVPENAAFNSGFWSYDATTGSYTKTSTPWSWLRWSDGQSYAGRNVRLEMDVETTTGTLLISRRNSADSGYENVATISGTESFSAVVYVYHDDLDVNPLRIDSNDWLGTIRNVRLAELPGRHMRAISDAARPILRKGANEATAALHPELVVNGTFDSDISDWEDHSTSPGYTAWDAGNLLLITGSAGSAARLRQVVPTEVGKTYRIKVRNNGPVTVATYIDTGSAVMQVPAGTTQTVQFTATETSIILSLRNFVVNSTASVDEISVRQVTGEAYWLESDGVDDLMIADGGTPFSTTVYTALAFRLLSFPGGQYPSILTNAAGVHNDPQFRQPLVGFNSVVPHHLVFQYGPSSMNCILPYDVAGADVVADGHVSPSSAAANANGATASTAGSTLTPGATAGLRIFGESKAHARFYGMIRTHTIPTAAQQAQIRQWLAAKSGGIA